MGGLSEQDPAGWPTRTALSFNPDPSARTLLPDGANVESTPACSLSEQERADLARAVHDATRCNCDSGLRDEMVADEMTPAVEAIVARHVATALRQVRDAFDPGELDCGRLGLTCVEVNPLDRWCRPCRIREALNTAAPPP